MKKVILVLFLVIYCKLSFANVQADKVLDKFHSAATEANYEDYMVLLAEHAIFLGTDPTERWTKSEFAGFVQPYFSRGQGWEYTSVSRNISEVVGRNDILIFDELLKNDTYGLCKGSGVLIKTTEGWKIAQYNLSVALENVFAKRIISDLKELRKPKPKIKE